MRRWITLAALVLAGCSSLEHPNFFRTSHDARVYNPQTGRYEWPDDAPPPAPRKPRVDPNEDRTVDDPPRGLLGRPDDRPFNPQTGRFEEPR